MGIKVYKVKPKKWPSGETPDEYGIYLIEERGKKDYQVWADWDGDGTDPGYVDIFGKSLDEVKDKMIKKGFIESTSKIEIFDANLQERDYE